MPTIKDVAREASVSVGTVSNVINGKTNNPELIEKVEAAVKKLGFRVNANARSLKMTRSYLIGVIIDHLEDRNVQYMIAAIEKILSSKGYNVIIKTTGNNEVVERKQVEQFLQLGVDGMIINTAIYHKAWFQNTCDENISVVFMEKPVHIQSKMDLIQSNYESAILECFQWVYKSNLKEIGIFLEKGMISNEMLYQSAITSKVNLRIQLVGDKSSESGFKAGYEMLSVYPNTEVIVAGSDYIARGIKKAIELLKLSQDIRIICIKTDNWIENNNTYAGIIEISPYEIGTIAANHLLSKINDPNNLQTNISIIDAVFKKMTKSLIYKRKNNQTKTLRVAVLDAPITRILEKLSKIYEQERDIRIKYVKMNYHQLWELVSNSVQMELFEVDLIMYDIIWKVDMLKQGFIQDISYLQQNNPSYFSSFIDGSIEKYGIYEDKLYGIPFMTGTQLMFYQKDLFEDPIQKIKYQRIYGKELEVPTNWNDFNTVAEFFTKSYNKDSPVKYGTALINQGNLYNSIEFLNYLWAYNGKIIANEKIDFKHPLTALALEEYKKSFCYTDRYKQVNEWEDMAEAFKQGDIAMVNLYDSYAFSINDTMESKVAGNVGSAMIPGGHPVLGGWSMGVYQESKNKELACDFALWACGEQLADPISILSGISSRKKYYQNKELDSIYPWKSKVLECYSKSKMRSVLKHTPIADSNIQFYDKILGLALGKMICEEMSVEEVMDYVHTHALQLIG